MSATTHPEHSTTLDGNPVNNFLKKEVCFNPDGILYDAKHIQIVGHYAYVSCAAGLVVIDIDDPKKPTVRVSPTRPGTRSRPTRSHVSSCAGTFWCTTSSASAG